MWLDRYCVLCLVNSRVKDLIDLGYGSKAPEMLRKLAEILEQGYVRSRAFAEAFNYVKVLTGSKDPYLEVKKRLRNVGMRVARIAEERLRSVNWDVREALRYSAAANIIDTSVLGYEAVKSLDEAIADKPVIEEGIEMLNRYRDVYISIDNAGEAEIDKLLAKALELHGYKVTIVVREEAYEIDETIESFEAEGFNVISTPGNLPPVALLSNGFVIAKGIASVEAYLERGDNALQTLHLFRAKCDVLAKKLKVPKNSVVIASGNYLKQLLSVL